jgi:hypothetical protein
MSKNTLIDQAQSRSLAIENDLNARGLLENLQDRFGNKYKLEFGDDYGNFKYRVLIQQRGYTGAILPMIGTNDPVVLQWEGDDDFYQPIKGSQCTINLMVTDSVTYDNFYDYPERTYKVLLQWFGYDAAPPASGPQTWNTFWTGWLVSDTFKEFVTTTPYPIILTAIDGLGTLDDYVLNPVSYRPQFATSNLYPKQITLISDVLRQIDLKLEIIATHEWVVYQSQSFISNTTAFDCFLFNGKEMNAKEILSEILKSTNSRIFQSDNKWCIIPNSCYEPKGFTSNISSYTAFLRYQPPNIRALKTGYLNTNNSEVVEFERFNQYGGYINQILKDAHVAMPLSVQNIGNDLVVEYLPPYKEVSIDYNIDSYNKRKYQVNANQFFSYGNTGYAIAVNGGITEGYIGQYEYTLEDSKYSYRGLQGATNALVYTEMIRTILPQTTENGLSKIKHTLSIQYLYDVDPDIRAYVDFDFRYTIKLTTPSGIKYYDADNEVWQTSIQYIAETSDYLNYNNIWETTQLDFKLPSVFYDNLEVIIYRPSMTYTAGYYGMYIGEISVQGVDGSQQKTHNYKSIQADNSNVYEQERTSIEHISGFNAFGQGSVSNGFVAKRPRDNYATWVPTNRAQVINKEIMNDFRSSLSRYEGTLKNNHYKPLSMLNRIWINFGASVLRLPDSCIIDTIEANLKRNEYKVNMHLPNIDSDQLAVETNQFKK